MMKLKMLAAAGVATAMALVPTAASAHEQWAYDGNDGGWTNHGSEYDGGYDFHHLTRIADHECDGHTVIMQIHFYNGTEHSNYDDNGCSKGGVYQYYDRRISSFRICEGNFTSSGGFDIYHCGIWSWAP